ncbi:unnamed protein product [Eruca vesicaria subsp. sativa]|uniref:Uncharacterized protein n=1 Tax=Eruca vesicaria subsp. sativa TaxID=29727 RepID=A0ABC8M6X7_ERUVS|nr:unnamed protein product [Eruca vesicaria subsp. sativa]
MLRSSAGGLNTLHPATRHKRGPRWLTSKPPFTLEREEKLYNKPWSRPIGETDWSETTRQERRQRSVSSSGGSRIPDLTQIRAQSATSSRPEVPKITQTRLTSPELRKEIKDAFDSRRFNESRDTVQGGKTEGEQQRVEAGKMDSSGGL